MLHLLVDSALSSIKVAAKLAGGQTARTYGNGKRQTLD